VRQAWQMWASQISPVHCDKLIEQFRHDQYIDGLTFNDEGVAEELQENENPFHRDNVYRKSRIRWVNDDEVRKLLFWYAQEANRVAFGTELTDVGSIQFTEYGTEYEGKYDWHHDVDWNSQAMYDRKISVVLQLSDGNYYEGCDFQFDEVPNPDPDALRAKGTIICFPSYLRHRVTEITKGTRYSLVAWFEGPRWK